MWYIERHAWRRAGVVPREVGRAECGAFQEREARSLPGRDIRLKLGQVAIGIRPDREDLTVSIRLQGADESACRWGLHVIVGQKILSLQVHVAVDNQRATMLCQDLRSDDRSRMFVACRWSSLCRNPLAH